MSEQNLERSQGESGELPDSAEEKVVSRPTEPPTAPQPDTRSLNEVDKDESASPPQEAAPEVGVTATEVETPGGGLVTSTEYVEGGEASDNGNDGAEVAQPEAPSQGSDDGVSENSDQEQDQS